MSEVILGKSTVASSGVRPRAVAASIPFGAHGSDVREVSLEEARAMAGFPIWQPTHLPAPGLAIKGVNVTIEGASGKARVTDVLSKYADGSGSWLALEQSRLFGGNARLGIPFAISEGRVGDSPAALFPEIVEATAALGGRIVVLHCMWERGGFLMELQAPNLTAEEIQVVAASLA